VKERKVSNDEFEWLYSQLRLQQHVLEAPAPARHAGRLAGWQPAGTLPPEDGGEWDGGYFSNDGQRVADEDARSLADTLERALPDVPAHDVLGDKAISLPAFPGERFVNAQTPVTPFEWFGGQKDVLQDFIAFCREGGFVIW
jgi:hypothetical protein